MANVFKTLLYWGSGKVVLDAVDELNKQERYTSADRAIALFCAFFFAVVLWLAIMTCGPFIERFTELNLSTTQLTLHDLALLAAFIPGLTWFAVSFHSMSDLSMIALNGSSKQGLIKQPSPVPTNEGRR